MPRRKPPSRLRYEAEHPSLTVRIPAEVKAAVLVAAQAEDLSVSEWVQAMAAGHAAKAADAYRRGRAEGEQAAGIAGFRAGLLTSAFAADHGRHYAPETVAQRLLGQPGHAAIAERLIPAAYQPDWARLLHAVGPGWAPVASP